MRSVRINWRESKGVFIRKELEEYNQACVPRLSNTSPLSRMDTFRWKRLFRVGVPPQGHSNSILTVLNRRRTWHLEHGLAVKQMQRHEVSTVKSDPDAVTFLPVCEKHNVHKLLMAQPRGLSTQGAWRADSRTQAPSMRKSNVTRCSDQG